MEKIKGIIEEIGTETIQIQGKDTAKFWVKVKGDGRKFSGLGNCQWKEGDEAEIEFETKTLDSGATFFNIRGKKKPYSGFGDVIKALTMPKVTVGYEKTVQERQFEPKKVSVYVSMNAEEIDPKKIQSMIQIAKGEVEAEISGIQSEQSTPSTQSEQSKPEPSQIEEAMAKSDRVDEMTKEE